MRRLVTLLAGLACLGVSSAAAQRYRALWGSSPTDLWIVGDGPHAIHFDGAAWARVPLGASHLKDVWGTAPGDVWAVGDAGVVVHWDGTAWTRVPVPTSADLRRVGGCSARDVVAIAGSPDDETPATILQWDGTEWSAELAPLPFLPMSMAAGSCTSMVIAGLAGFDPRPDQRRFEGVLLRRAGARWSLTGHGQKPTPDTTIARVALQQVAMRGTRMALLGRTADGESRVLVSGTRGLRQLPAAGAPSGAGDSRMVERLVMLGDGSLVALTPRSSSSLLARWTERGGWAPVPLSPATALLASSAQRESGGMTDMWAPSSGPDAFILTFFGDILRVTGDVVVPYMDRRCHTEAVPGPDALPWCHQADRVAQPDSTPPPPAARPARRRRP